MYGILIVSQLTAQHSGMATMSLRKNYSHKLCLRCKTDDKLVSRDCLYKITYTNTQSYKIWYKCYIYITLHSAYDTKLSIQFNNNMCIYYYTLLQSSALWWGPTVRIIIDTFTYYPSWYIFHYTCFIFQVFLYLFSHRKVRFRLYVVIYLINNDMQYV